MDTRTKIDVTWRLRCAEGHLHAVIRMIEEDGPCLVVLQQTQAVQGALRQINLLLIAHHLEVCLRQAWGDRPVDGYEKLRDELLALFVRKV